MTTKSSIRLLLGILVISVWVPGSAIQAGAETLNFKLYRGDFGGVFSK